MGQYCYESKVKTGQVVNLMKGMEPEASSLFAVCTEMESSEPLHALRATSYWGPFPILAGCSTVEELAQALFEGFQIKGRKKEFVSGAILKGDSQETEEKLERFGEYVGLEAKWLDSEKYGFVLVRVPRILDGGTDELTEKTECRLQETIGASINELSQELSRDVQGNIAETGENISAVLDSLQGTIGTHYIRKVQTGDDAFQVFVYEKKVYEQICDSMDKNGWERERAFGFRFFTSDLYVKKAGKVRFKTRNRQMDRLREYLEDLVYGRKESVFALFLNKEAYKIIDEIDSVTCVGAELIPVYEIGCLQDKMGRLVYDTTVQAGIARFGAACAGPFSSIKENQIDYAALYGDFSNVDMLTLLWTPMMSLSQMYICADDFLAMKVVNRKVVKHLLFCADIVEIKGRLDLSFLDSFTVVCRTLICHTQEGGCRVSLSQVAFENLRIYCASVDGSCQFVLPDGRVPEGLLYYPCGAFLTEGNAQVRLKHAVSGETPAKELVCPPQRETLDLWICNGIKTGLQAMLTSASVPLMAGRQAGRENRVLEQEAWRCMEWVCRCYSEAILEAEEENTKKNMFSLYGSAMAVLRRSVNPFEEEADRPQQISIFTYETYEKPINRILDLCVEYERELQKVKEEIRSYNEKLERHYQEENLRENLKELAEFLNRQNEAMQQYQADIRSQEQSIYQSRNTELLALQKQSTQLAEKIEAYKDEFGKKIDELKAAIESKKKQEAVKAAFQFAESLCSIVGSIGQGYCNWSGISRAQEAERVLKRWEAFLNSMKAVDAITKFGIDMDEAVSRLGGWEAEHPGFTECPTAMDWEIFMHDCKAQIVPLEKDFPAETAQYQCVLENIVSCARQQDEYMSQISRIQAEMSQLSAQAKTAEEQGSRLKELSVNITSPDWQPQEDALADMGQCAAVLAQKEQAMLLRLAALIHLQSGAMEYQYCGTWEPVTSFTLKSVRENLAGQSLAAVQGMQSFLSVPTDLRLPLLYEAQLPAEVLMGESGGEIEVPMDLGMWRNLSHVRINGMDVRLEGIRTSSGRCHVKLVTSGDPMKDRGIGSESLSFQMPSRDWFVVYDTVSDQTIMYTEPSRDWGKYFAKPTPFQKIRIGLAKTPENNGATFSEDMVNVKIWFYLEASYRENACGGLTKRSADSNTVLQAVPDFVSALAGYTITGGWDVINFLSVTAINNLWEVRWQKEVEKEYEEKDRQFLQSIDVSYSVDYPGGITIRTRLETQLGAPGIQFMQDGLRRVQVTIPIISGKICTDTIQGGETIGHKEDEIQVCETNRPVIKFALDMNKIAGSADNSGKVFLTPAPEAVSLENIQIEGEVLVSICNEIVAYIKEKGLQPWYLGEVKYPCEIDFLRPRDFYFQTFLPESEFATKFPEVLGIFILTKTQKPPCAQIEKTWPKGTWPISADLDAAVYFSEDILWNYEIKGSLESQIKARGYACSTVQDNGYKIQVSGTKEIAVMQQTFRVGYISSMGTVNMHDSTEDIKVKFPINGAVITTSCEGISIDYKGSWKEKLPYICQYPSPYGTEYCISYKDVTFTCEFHGISRATVDKEGKTISFSPFQTDPVVTADQPAKTFFQLDFEMVQDNILQAAKQALVREIGELRLQLCSMPVFAVSNLLFPEQQTMTPKDVYIPRDLVMTGNIMIE